MVRHWQRAQAPHQIGAAGARPGFGQRVACHASVQPAPRLAQLQHDDVFGAVTKERGFLPAVRDPCQRLTVPGSEPWEAALADIPKLCVVSGQGRLRTHLASLPPFPTQLVLQPGSHETSTQQPSHAETLWRAYYLLSFIAHAYLWCEEGPTPQSLPAVIAQPWNTVAQTLDMPPVLVYATYNLLNWRRLDPASPIELGNIVCLANFQASLDEEWFRLIHVAIEAQAAEALAVLPGMIQAAAQGHCEAVSRDLATITRVLKNMQATLARMGEKCDPYVYYARVRQPMSGWRNNPALPQGLLYEGCVDGSGAPLRLSLYGETGAQSSVVPALDIALGIGHQEDWLKQYLLDMRAHMPPAHRQYLLTLEQQSKVSPQVSKVSAGASARDTSAPVGAGVVRSLCARAGGSSISEAYNDAVTELEKFRGQHKAFAYTYIAKWAKQETKGTGGSDFMPALKGYQETTSKHLLPAQ